MERNGNTKLNLVLDQTLDKEETVSKALPAMSEIVSVSVDLTFPYDLPA